MSDVDIKREAAIRRFHETAVDVEGVLERVRDVFGECPDSDLHTAIWQAMNAHIQSLDDAYGIGDWIEWWWHECHLGANPLEAGCAGQMRRIATVDDLIELVLGDCDG